MPDHGLDQFFPREQFGALLAAVPLTMGQSGASVYSATTETGDYILRIHGGNYGPWEQVSTMQALASDHGIAPRLVHTDAAAHATVSVKIPDFSFGAAVSNPATRAAAIGSLLGVLAKLQSIPIDGMAATGTLDFARTVWAAQSQRPAFPQWALPLGTRIEQAAELLDRDGRLVMGHGDLHPANILWDGTRVWLVDWERAGPLHPYIDLATLCNFLGLPPEAGMGLLTHLERGQVDLDRQLLFASVRDLCRIVYGVVFLSLVDDLAQTHIGSRDNTPTLSECFGLLATGQASLSDATLRAQIGTAFLNQCQ